MYNQFNQIVTVGVVSKFKGIKGVNFDQPVSMIRGTEATVLRVDTNVRFHFP